MAKKEYYIDMMSKDWREFVHPQRIPILEKRIEVTSSCRDCDDLPRVENAGQCFVDPETGCAIQIMHNGLKVLYGRYYGKWVNEIIGNLKGVHEPQEERVFYEVLKHIPAGATMIELGAYWGYYSAWFAQTVPNARVILVEPHSNQFKVAKQNFELNNLKGEFLLGYVGEYPEKKKTTQERRLGDELACFTIHEIMQSREIDRLNVLHSDIQGYEAAMLENSRHLLMDRRIDWLFVSTHGKAHRRSMEIFQEVGYRIYAEHSIGRSASADGLIVAQNPQIDEIPAVSISMVEGIVSAHD